jgi:hypothetical protein
MKETPGSGSLSAFKKLCSALKFRLLTQRFLKQRIAISDDDWDQHIKSLSRFSGCLVFQEYRRTRRRPSTRAKPSSR